MFESEVEIVEDLIKGYGEEITLGNLLEILKEKESYYDDVELREDININIYNVSTGYQVVHENRVLGVGENFYEVSKIIKSWTRMNGIDLREVVIGGDCID